MNHNEIVGWENNEQFFSNYYVLWLMDDEMNSRNKSRKNIISEILLGLDVSQQEIKVDGNSFKERFLLLIHYGDWLSYWCGKLNDVDIDAVKSIDLLKKKIS